MAYVIVSLVGYLIYSHRMCFAGVGRSVLSMSARSSCLTCYSFFAILDFPARPISDRGKY